jgi:hypothetical protein
MGTGSGADASACGGVAVSNKANGVGSVGSVSVISDAVGFGAGNTTNGGVGAGKASFVPKTNSSIAARAVCVSWCSCQRSHNFLKHSAVLFPRI